MQESWDAAAPLCAIAEVPILDCDKYSFTFDLIETIGGSRFVELLDGYESANQTYRRVYTYIRSHSLLASSVILENEVDCDIDSIIHSNVKFMKTLSSKGKYTLLYRICVGTEAIAAQNQRASIQTELSRVIFSLGTAVRGYLRLSGVYADHMAFHVVFQCNDTSIIKSFEDNIAMIGKNRKPIEYSKYVFNKGVVFKAFECLIPSGEMMKFFLLMDHNPYEIEQTRTRILACCYMQADMFVSRLLSEII